MEECLISEDKYDRLALMWLLYERDPKNLELVFHLDRVQRKGFARMILGRMPEGSETSASEFFEVANIQAVLDRYEREKRTLRQSHCAAVLYDGGNYQLFIKRDLKSSFVAHGPENTFGWEREWIVALLHGTKAGEISPSASRHQESRITEFGMPSGAIWLSTWTAIIASVSWESDFLARRLSPMMRLYRYIPFSARA